MDSQILWTLIALQVTMGAFDTLVHHEMTERLAWRPSQRTELTLHGIRNLFYAAILLMIGWTKPFGVYALLLAAVLTVEILITLWDFVEEDFTRRLPATERITHTLMALNYGAILAFAGPVLFTWSQQPTTLVAVDHGYWSLFTTTAAAGVTLFGIRDIAAAFRATRMTPAPAYDLAKQLSGHRRILIIGATGFIGTRLVSALSAGNHHVTVLTRSRDKASSLPAPIRIVTGLHQIQNDERFDCIVNLAGEPVANGLWTRRKKREIIRSRLRVTRRVVDLIARLDHKPECLINGSAIGWYGLWQDEALDETSDAHDCFVHRVCNDWETAANRAAAHGLRVVCLRMGLVLGTDGGMLARLLTPFEFGVGGPIGDGRQWMSWIALDDLIRLIVHTIDDTSLAGPVNATAPNPVRNEDFTAALGRALNRPAVIRLPAKPLRVVLGKLADEALLGGQRVLPAKAAAAGFTFKWANIDDALRAITGAIEPADANRHRRFQPLFLDRCSHGTWTSNGHDAGGFGDSLGPDGRR